MNTLQMRAFSDELAKIAEEGEGPRHQITGPRFRQFLKETAKDALIITPAMIGGRIVGQKLSRYMQSKLTSPGARKAVARYGEPALMGVAMAGGMAASRMRRDKEKRILDSDKKERGRIGAP